MHDDAPDQDGISHDKLFKTVFRMFFQDLVEIVHPELAAILDLDNARPAGESLFADFRRKGHVRPDLVMEAPRRDGAGSILFNLEAERKYRIAFEERMPRYSMHIHLQVEKPVVSIAAFLTGGPKGIEIREVPYQAGPFEVWRFRYLAFGLSRCRAEDFLDRPQPLAAALAALMRPGEWDPVEHKLRCLHALSRKPDLSIEQRFVLVKIVDTYVELSPQEQERFAAVVRRQENKEVRKMVVTWEEALAEREAKGLNEGLAKGLNEGLAKGLNEGLAKGLNEGLAKGRVQATQEAILLWTRSRFRSLPVDFEQKILAIDDLDRLHEILERIPEASSAEDLAR